MHAGDGGAYPYSCKPEDVMFAQESMRERYVFTDVQLRRLLPSYVLNEWERRGFSIRMEAGDEQILREGTYDYSGFSYLRDQRASKRKAAPVTPFPASRAACRTRTSRRPTGAGRLIR